MLYFDERLSANGAVSCASCHRPDAGWGDDLDLSFGFPPGTPHWRNTQTIINSAYLPKLGWAGEKTSYESQAKSAFGGITAQNLDSVLAEERLRQIPEYVEMFENVFGSADPTFENVLHAVAAFESTIVSTNVPFDAYLQGDTTALSDSALRGVELFVGAAGCSACHGGELLTDNSFHAIGVPNNPKFGTEPLRQVTLRYQNAARGIPEDLYRTIDTDLGLYYVTKQEIDKGKFRTPMLREVGQTGPYMHNGVFQTLEEVVDFYNEGGGEAENKSPLMRPLDLNAQELADLVAFLETVTGDSIIVEAPELPSYQVLK
jgi:cytochrome c peroxidase